MFSENSETTVVLTSCGRFNLLTPTINSFLKYNTEPIRNFIIIEDSGDETVHSSVPENFKEHFTIILNKPNLGQIKSIDKAYSLVKTKYVFHCEDDWEFYRSGFIEESIKILESNSQILQVWLRDYYHDIKVHSPYHYLGDKQTIDQINFHKVETKKEDWQGFSFNPGIKRYSDYLKMGLYDSFGGEKVLSKAYHEAGYFAVILENSAVAHIGFDNHVEDVREKLKKRKKKKKRLILTILLCLISIFIGYIIGRL
ncbi:MAG: glycosyltransferase [Lentisphaeraceae bacterium]|nr:glycosyltransferase [Lentisphaeraceae bacterium]